MSEEMDRFRKNVTRLAASIILISNFPEEEMSTIQAELKFMRDIFDELIVGGLDTNYHRINDILREAEKPLRELGGWQMSQHKGPKGPVYRKDLKENENDDRGPRKVLGKKPRRYTFEP